MVQITDWDDAYDNRKHTPNVEQYVTNWPLQAAIFRQSLLDDGRAKLDIAYGEKPREKFDIFYPKSKPNGLAIYIHGGYWMKFDKSQWSHFAAGALDNDYAVAIPSYSLAPEVKISQITRQIATAIDCAAGIVDGDIFLAGHSAGGHLVCRMMCQDSQLSPDTQSRIKSVLSISGVHDLRPLLCTQMNDVLTLSEAEANAESPALLLPKANVKLTCIAGTSERDEFIRQNELMANIWLGLGAHTKVMHAADKNHFSIVEGLKDANSAITKAFLGK